MAEIFNDKIFRISDPADPNRCQANGVQGNQCLNKAIKLPDGSYGTVCAAHGGAKQYMKTKREELKNYNLTIFRSRIGKMANSEGIKSLRDEIGILRVMLESLINRCEDETELLLQSHRISDMIDKISRLVTGCHKIEGSMGQLLDKQAILQFAAEVINIISSNITDKVTLEKIADEIMDALSRDKDA